MAFLLYGMKAEENASYMENGLRATIAIVETERRQDGVPPLISEGQFVAVREWLILNGALETTDSLLKFAADLLLLPCILCHAGKKDSHDFPSNKSRKSELYQKGAVLADVHHLLCRLPTDSLRRQLHNIVLDSDVSVEVVSSRVDVPKGWSAPIEPIPPGWINPHSFEWLWDMKPGVFTISPPAAKEFEKHFAPIASVVAEDGTPSELSGRYARHNNVFVVPAHEVQGLQRLAGRRELERDGVARKAREQDKIIFVSHRWDGSNHPDPSGMQLKCLKSLAAWLTRIGHRDIAFWYDYCSLPQSPFTPDEEKELRTSLASIPQLLERYAFFRCPGGRTLHSHLARGWCMLETALGGQALIPADDSVGAMLRNWLFSTPPMHRCAVVADWESIWETEIASIGGFENARILAWIGLSPNHGDPMNENGQLSRLVLSDIVNSNLPHDLRGLVMRCSVPADTELVLNLWKSAESGGGV